MRSSVLPTASDHYQVTLDDILNINRRLIEHGGGRDGIVRMESILGAIGRP